MIISMLKRRVKENQVFNGGTKLWAPQRLAASVVIELAWYRAFLHVYGKCETDGFLLSLHVLPFICNVDENGIFHVANFAWGLRLLQWSTNPLFFKCDCFCVMEHSLTSQIVQPFWGGSVGIFSFLWCCSLGIAHASQNSLQPWMYLDTSHIQALWPKYN